MRRSVLEVERKLAVGADVPMPSLHGLAPELVPGEVSHRALAATYLDTEDLRLQAARMTLRHRDGDADAGWRLKVPARDGRLELHSSGPPPPAPVPDELLALVRSRTRSRPLLPVAVLRTDRTVHPLLDADGRLVIEVVDDLVEGARAGSEEVLRWREWEVELVAGSPAALDVVHEQLMAAGGEPASWGSKVAKVLAGGSDERGWWAPPSTRLGRKPSAADVVQAHLVEQVDELLGQDPHVRRDAPDAVHKMRVATRRLRSALTTFRPLLDREVTDPLREELRWLATGLGHARDAEVLHARLRDLLAQQPAELILGPVVQRVDDMLLGRYREAHARAVSDLDSERFMTLLDALEELAAAPPWTGGASQAAQQVLPRFVARVDRRLHREMQRAQAMPPGAPQDAVLHEGRKLAKRLRCGRGGGARSGKGRAPASRCGEVAAGGARRPPGQRRNARGPTAARRGLRPGRPERLHLRPAARAGGGARPGAGRVVAPGVARGLPAQAAELAPDVMPAHPRGPRQTARGAALG